MFANLLTTGGKQGKGRSTNSGKLRQPAAKCLLLLAFAIAAPASRAQGLAPETLLRAVSVEVSDRIREDPELQAADPQKVAALVESTILPLFDFARMTRLAMAHNWRLATPEQQRLLIDEFKTLLVRTYSTALAHYRGEVIQFRQLRAAPLHTEVTVRSEVKQTGRESRTVDYLMEKTAAGWKIYDVKLAGVRLVSTYRDVFAEKVRESGVDGLIRFLADGNQGRGARFNAIKTAFWERSRVMYEIFRDVFRGGRQ